MATKGSAADKRSEMPKQDFLKSSFSVFTSVKSTQSVCLREMVTNPSSLRMVVKL